MAGPPLSEDETARTRLLYGGLPTARLEELAATPADLRPGDAGKARRCELDGLTILRAIAKHHYGPHGFLTEGVDWNDHVGQKHHINQAKYGAIQYTEPFLNNQHIVEPTLFYLEKLATRTARDGTTEWRDGEGNRLLALPVKAATR